VADWWGFACCASLTGGETAAASFGDSKPSSLAAKNFILLILKSSVNAPRKWTNCLTYILYKSHERFCLIVREGTLSALDKSRIQFFARLCDIRYQSAQNRLGCKQDR
jgi:hypothetical protein